MKQKHTATQEVAALKSGIDRKTARKYLKEGKLPTELKKDRDWRTRSDIFESVWPERSRIRSKISPRMAYRARG